MSTGYYKFGYSDPGATQYYNNNQSYEVYDHMVGINEYNERQAEYPSTMTVERTAAINQQSERRPNRDVNTTHRDCEPKALFGGYIKIVPVI